MKNWKSEKLELNLTVTDKGFIGI